ncbi:hypothetical protein N7478_005143 [Penicillium angulare]|uniref:uncharacterized protein n=1 Tax=Penicillium angulare TaxID=116970 RepID=UPI00253FA529|nr:uncharacterized protein N7478_005143 [Penicillium angulare]KAJ5279771.1 hypothetical protein N7478_005143 [Penicillium angulare]
MDIMANGVDGRTILKGSKMKATAPGGSFYFDEFIDAMRQRGAKTKVWTGNTGVGKNLTPDVLDAAKGILDTGNTGTKTDRYAMNEDPNKLFPDDFKRGQSVQFPDLYGKVYDVIQASRKKVSGDGVVSGNTQADFDTALSRGRDATKGMHQGRIADGCEKEIAWMNNEFTQNGLGISVETKEKSAMDGLLKWNQADPDATLTKNEAHADTILKSFIQFTKNDDSTGSEIKGEANHRAALLYAQTCSSRIYGNEDC